MELIRLFILCIILAIAAFWDIKYFRVSNRLIILGMIIGIIFNMRLSGLFGLGFSIVNYMIPIILLFIFHVFAMIGAADIKLFALISLYLGISKGLQSIIIAFLIGALFSIIIIFKNRILMDRVHYFSNYFRHIISTKEVIPYYTEKDKKERHLIHFSGCIFLSILCLTIIEFKGYGHL